MTDVEREAIRLEIIFGDKAVKVVDEIMSRLKLYPENDKFDFNWMKHYKKVRKQIMKQLTPCH